MLYTHLVRSVACKLKEIKVVETEPASLFDTILVFGVEETKKTIEPYDKVEVEHGAGVATILFFLDNSKRYVDIVAYLTTEIKNVFVVAETIEVAMVPAYVAYIVSNVFWDRLGDKLAKELLERAIETSIRIIRESCKEEEGK